MTERPDRTESIFAAAVALTNAAERDSLLDRECADDAILRDRIAALLQAHDRAGHLLDRPVPGGVEQTMASVPGEQPGHFIAGRYKLLESIGEGGMGTVWVAEQIEPVRRKVALKLIKAGMDSKSVLARFEAERQALAVMDHPNIAKVLDGGLTDSGRPYFVMEYVKGVPITEYCDATRLNVAERLNLFVQVCQAVQHAHQKGIIHRDLKPSNILVAPYDDKPVPKVIDFGLAKAMHQSLTERTLHTAHETVLGTPLYMSPEQAQLNNIDVDTRSDIYSLGVLLYELLTGTTPLEKQRFKEAAWDEVRRIIREEEPPRPSTRISSITTLPSLAAGRQIEPGRLTKLVRGELDWIVMKALEKNRARRYETANGFAADVERYLTGEPVLAAPPSVRYRLGKFARKHRAALTTATAIGLLLVAGAAVSAWQAVRAMRAEADARSAEEVATGERDRAVKADRESKSQRDNAVTEKQRADDEAAVATAVNDFLVKDLLNPAAAGAFGLGGQVPPNSNLRVSDLIDRAAEHIGDRFKDQPRIEAALREVLGSAYNGLHQQNQSLAQWTRVAELKAMYLGSAHPETLMYRMVLAEQFYTMGRTEDALRIWDEVRTVLTTKGNSRAPEYVEDLQRLAGGYSLIPSRAADALAISEQIRDVQAAIHGQDHPIVLQAMLNLVRIYKAAGRAADANRVLEQVQSVASRPEQKNDQQLANVLGNLGNAYRELSRPADAIPIFKRQLDMLAALHGPDSGRVTALSVNLGYTYLEAGRPADAIPVFERVRDRRRQVSGPYSSDTLEVQFLLSLAYRQSGRPDDAIPLLEKLRDVYADAGGDPDGQGLGAVHSLALAYREAGRLPDAIAEYDLLAPKYMNKWGAENELTRNLYSEWISALETNRQFARAAEVLSELLAVERKIFPPEHPDAVLSLFHIGQDLLLAGRANEAEPFLRECLAVREKKEPDAWTTFNTKSLLGGTLLGQNKYTDAEPLLLAGYEGMKQREALIPAQVKVRLPEALDRIIELYTAMDKPDEMEKWRAEQAKLPQPAAPAADKK